MDKKVEGLIKKKMKEGWIKANMMIEAMAISKEAVENALKKHVEKMEGEKDMMVYHKDFSGTNEVERPTPNISKGFSQVVEVEAIFENFDKLINMVLAYGPSSVEILEPDKINMKVGEAQGIVNNLAMLIHRFAATGAGAMMVST
jgi:hypothetical protein